MIHSANTTGDLAEFLFCRAMEWKPKRASAEIRDALDKDRNRYQIKGRKISRGNPSRQLSALRGLPEGGFQYLAAVLFEPDYSVHRAAIVPHALVLQNSSYEDHTKSWRFFLRKRVWDWPGVRDVTDDLRRVEL